MTESDLHSQGRRVREAARELAQATDTQRRAVLKDVADQLEERCEQLLEVNRGDQEAYRESGPGKDRLMLNQVRVASMASALREIAATSDPLHELVDQASAARRHRCGL